MTFGYVRVSTAHQKLTRQIKNIKEVAKDAVIFEETWTGTTTDRPQFRKLLSIVRPGDTIIFDEISRMSRNAEEGFTLYKNLYQREVNLIFIKESALNTDVFRRTQQISLTGSEIADEFIKATNRVLWMLAEQQIIEAFKSAELEVTLLHKRVSEGVSGAVKKWDEDEVKGIEHDKRKPGRQKGSTVTTRKSIDAKENIRKHAKCFGGSLSDSEVQKLCGVSRNTYYRYKAELKKET